MNRDHPAWAAHQMRNLDEHVRNALIAQSDNVIDIRDHCEGVMAEPHAQRVMWIELDFEE